MPDDNSAVEEVKAEVPAPEVKEQAEKTPAENFDEKMKSYLSDEPVEDKIETPVEKAEEKPVILDELKERAKTLGVSDYALSKFSNQDELTRFIDIREHEIIDAGKRLYNNNQSTSVEAIPPVEQPPVEQPQVDLSGAYKVAFKEPDMIDEELLSNIEGMNKHYAGLFQSLAQKVTQMESGLNSTMRLHEDREIEKFDNLVSSLPPEYKEFVGEGHLNDLLGDKSKEGFKKTRDAIWDEKESLKLGYQQMRIKPPSDKELFKKAVDIVLADKKEIMIKNQIKQKAQTRESQVIGRASTRNSDNALSGAEKAARRIDEARAAMLKDDE